MSIYEGFFYQELDNYETTSRYLTKQNFLSHIFLKEALIFNMLIWQGISTRMYIISCN